MCQWFFILSRARKSFNVHVRLTTETHHIDTASTTESKETATGWKSKESIEELKEKFHNLTRRAKQEAYDGDFEASLKLYKKAYKIQKSKIVAQRIAKLKVWKCCS